MGLSKKKTRKKTRTECASRKTTKKKTLGKTSKTSKKSSKKTRTECASKPRTECGRALNKNKKKVVKKKTSKKTNKKKVKKTRTESRRALNDTRTKSSKSSKSPKSSAKKKVVKKRATKKKAAVKTRTECSRTKCHTQNVAQNKKTGKKRGRPPKVQNLHDEVNAVENGDEKITSHKKRMSKYYAQERPFKYTFHGDDFFNEDRYEEKQRVKKYKLLGYCPKCVGYIFDKHFVSKCIYKCECGFRARENTLVSFEDYLANKKKKAVEEKV